MCDVKVANFSKFIWKAFLFSKSGSALTFENKGSVKGLATRCGVAVDVEWVDRQVTRACPVAPLYVTHIYIFMDSVLHVCYIYVYIHVYVWCCSWCRVGRPPKYMSVSRRPFICYTHIHTHEFRFTCISHLCIHPWILVVLPTAEDTRACPVALSYVTHTYIWIQMLMCIGSTYECGDATWYHTTW